MPIVYVATNANRLKAIEVENNTGEWVRTIQDINPIVQPRPVSESSSENCDIENVIDNGDGKTNKERPWLGWGWWTSRRSVPKAATEWIERHPTFSLLYVFTSFGSTSSAVVTTYRILGVRNHGSGGGGGGDGDGNAEVEVERGRLQKLGSVATRGLQASHATFSPDFVREHSKPPSTLCIGHYLDGSLSFFDCSKDAALDEPQRVVVLPEVRHGTRTTRFPNPLPSVHHVTYNPRPVLVRGSTDTSDTDSAEDTKLDVIDNDKDVCHYLLVSDTSHQGRVWTFAVDSIGMPFSTEPVSYHKVTHITPPSGWLTRILMGPWVIGLADYRIRRCVVHPNGRYAYLLLEFNTVIRVYEIQPVTGRICGDCLQEIPAIDPDYFAAKATGAAIHASAELLVTNTELWVSNRGIPLVSRGSWATSDVRIFSIEHGGAKLVPKQSLDCLGPVRHFVGVRSDRNASGSPTRLVVGSDPSPHGDESHAASIETFVRSDPEEAGGAFRRVGCASVGMDSITCVAVLPLSGHVINNNNAAEDESFGHLMGK
eukprot:jgi/Psemu1/321899/estExt_fgenesh1_pg.C_130018